MSDLTDAGIQGAIRRFLPNGKRELMLTDGGAKGDGRLCLRLRRRERKDERTGATLVDAQAEWFAVSRHGDRRVKRKLGNYASDENKGMTLKNARNAFLGEYREKIAKGQAPTGPRSRATKEGKTIEDLFIAYVASLEARQAPGAIMARRVLLGTDGPRGGSKGVVEEIGAAMLAKDVQAEHITACLEGFAKRGALTLGNRVRSYLAAAFEFGIKSRHSWDTPAGGVDYGIKSNPVRAVPRSKDGERAGERHLSVSEVRAFWQWLENKDKRSNLPRMLRLSLATGQREIELLRITSSTYREVPEAQRHGSFEWCLDWADTKTGWNVEGGRPHAIPLPPVAVTIMKSMTPDTDGQYFKADKRAKREGTLPCPDAVNRWCKTFYEKTGTLGFSARDLRRTWTTLAGAAGLSREEKDLIQNHAEDTIQSKHYDRYGYWPEKCAAMAKWSAYLDRILSGEFDNDAVG